MMAVLSISKTLSGLIAEKSERMAVFMQPEADDFVRGDPHFTLIFNAVSKLLEDDCHVVLKNIGFNRNRTIFESFVKLFGRYYGNVEYTGIKLDCAYSGCHYRPIELHTDDAIDSVQPKYGFIQVLREDPCGQAFGWNGVVPISKIVWDLQANDPALLEALLNHPVPMLSYGVSAYGESRQEILIKAPILVHQADEYWVRFDLTRIRFHYYKKQLSIPQEERLMIEQFLDVCRHHRQRYRLSAGDMLILDNQRTLHDREEASIELDETGQLNSREIFVSFAYED